MRATTPMRDAVSIDTTDSPGNTSLATAATIRKIAGPGIGNHLPTLARGHGHEQAGGHDEDDGSEVDDLGHGPG